MTRKDFIFNIIEKVFKPLFYLCLLIYLIYFFKNTIFSNGLERLLVITLLILTGLILISNVLKNLFKSLWNKIPEKLKSILNFSKKIINYIAIVFFLFLIYNYWNEKKVIIIFLGLAFLFHFFIERQRKTT
jgi:hypothetical protein